MANKINITSFLVDTKKLIKEGCHRKVVLQFQVFPIINNHALSIEQAYKLYHRHVHALLKIINEYRYKQSSQKNKYKLYGELIPSLNQWIDLYSTQAYSLKQSNLLQQYLLQTGICLLHDSKSSEQCQILIDSLHKLITMVINNNQSHDAQYYKVFLHYTFAVNQMKHMNFEIAMEEFNYVISQTQSSLPRLLKASNDYPRKSLVFKYLKLIIFSFLMMSYIYKQNLQLLLSKECLNHCDWFAHNSFKNTQLQYLITSILDQFNKRFIQYFLDRTEINRIMDRVIGGLPTSPKAQKQNMHEFINQQMFEKYDYHRLNNLQLFINTDHKTYNIAVSNQPCSQKSQRQKRSPTMSASIRKSILLYTEPASTTSRNESTVLPHSTMNIQRSTTKVLDSDPSSPNFYSQTAKKEQQATKEELTELQLFLQTMQPKEEPIFISTTKVKQPQKYNLDRMIENLIKSKLKQNMECEDYTIMTQKMQLQQTNQKKISEKSSFGIKLLNCKRLSCKIYGKEPNQVDGEIIFLKNKTKSKFYSETKFFKDKQQAKNQISRGQRVIQTDRSSNIQEEELSPLKKAQQIMLKYSNKLGLQSFKREMKRHTSQPSLSERNKSSPPIHEEQEPQQLYNIVQQKNTSVLKLLMEQYEKEQQASIKPRLVVSSLHEDYVKPPLELAKSTFMNFVDNSLKRVASQRNFKDIAIAQYQVVRSRRLKQLSIP